MASFGVLTLTGSGVPYDVMEGTTYSVQTVERTAARSMNGRTHYREVQVAPFLEALIVLSDGLKSSTFANFSGDVQLQLRSGTTAIVRDCKVVGRPEVNADEGTMTVRWEGQSGEEL